MIAKIHIARKELALDEETYRQVLERVTGKTSSGEMSFRQLDAVLTEFKRLGWKPKAGKPHRPASSKPHVAKVFAVWGQMCRDGIPKDQSRDALIAFVRRMTKSADRPNGLDDPEWLTADQARQVVEGLKAWRKRELFNRRKAR
jgi:phage gp16-like protein